MLISYSGMYQKMLSLLGWKSGGGEMQDVVTILMERN